MDLGGPVMLLPNALKVLDVLGIYGKVKSQGTQLWGFRVQ